MRNVPGERMTVRGIEIYVEQGGAGETCVLFESGAGAGRTLWDPVVSRLGDVVRTVTYDRAGRGRSARVRPPQSIDEMAATLAALVEALAPRRLILAGHSMGGLIVRRAAENLVPQPIGMVLVDPTPEAAPFYADWAATAAKTDRVLAVQQSLARVRPVMRVLTASYGRMFPADTYETMLREDFTPAGIACTRAEFDAFAAGIGPFRDNPPQPPRGEVVLISARRANRLHARHHDTIREYQRRFADQVSGRFEDADSEHIVPAECPDQVAAAVLRMAGAPERAV
ncbi:alpha/beta fold hydrolase [Nocardia nova]|uniref:alpha/beta fold hydrolase n=1 Tax=Nocardia nova TaxID=37330 RepID=UPI003797FBC2